MSKEITLLNKHFTSPVSHVSQSQQSRSPSLDSPLATACTLLTAPKIQKRKKKGRERVGGGEGRPCVNSQFIRPLLFQISTQICQKINWQTESGPAQMNTY